MDPICSICLDIFYKPIVLTCGHSFCLSCIAAYYETSISDGRLCPLCLKFWSTLPAKNYELECLIDSLFPEIIQERERNTTEETKLKVKQFLNAHSGLRNKLYLIISGRVSSYIYASFLIILILVYLFNYLLTIHSYEYINIENWSTETTIDWLKSLGSWTNQRLVHIASDISLNGTQLIHLKHENLTQRPFELVNEAHRLFLLNSIKAYKASSLTKLYTLTHFKINISPKSLFYLMSYIYYPRLVTALVLNNPKAFNSFLVKIPKFSKDLLTQHPNLSIITPYESNRVFISKLYPKFKDESIFLGKHLIETSDIIFFVLIFTSLLLGKFKHYVKSTKKAYLFQLIILTINFMCCILFPEWQLLRN